MNKTKENEQGKKCFIITPIGNENSDTFRKAKGVIESVIKPVLKENGFDDIKPAYEINVSGMINTQIINRIIEDDLVIANLTGNNPNVMYELCLRHVVAKPIIHICENGTTLPFDIKDNRTVFYENDMFGAQELKEKIILFLGEISYKEEYMDNPIYTAYRQGKLLKETQGTEKNEIMNLLLGISDKLGGLEMRDNRQDERGKTIRSRYPIYTKEQYERDIRTIEKKKIKALKFKRQDMTPDELSNQLNIPKQAVLIAADNAKIDVYEWDSLSFEEVNRILEYILMEQAKRE